LGSIFQFSGRIQVEKDRGKSMVKVFFIFPQVKAPQNKDGKGYPALPELYSFLSRGHTEKGYPG
jgi:hypothetical protein